MSYSTRNWYFFVLIAVLVASVVFSNHEIWKHIVSDLNPDRFISIVLDDHDIVKTSEVVSPAKTQISYNMVKQRNETTSNSSAIDIDASSKVTITPQTICNPSSSSTHCHVKTIRALFVDCYFPVETSKWRIEEIFAFTLRYRTDILVDRSFLDKHVWKSVAYEEMNSRFQLCQDYDILIFDKNFNFLNNFNAPDFNGTTYNGAGPSLHSSYMLRRREYRHEPVDFMNDYHVVYHIFLMLYRRYHNFFPESRQWIHLYPGGGLLGMRSLRRINSAVGIVVTQPAIHDWVKKMMPDNHVVFALGGSFLQPDTPMIPKNCTNIRDRKIAVCFTVHNQNDWVLKGGDVFQEALQELRDKNPELYKRLDIYVAGGSRVIDGAISVGLMSQEKLDKFYHDTIDIYINTELGLVLNGWPLGMEALLQGAVGIQTDPLHVSKRSEWNVSSDEMVIVKEGKDGIPEIVSNLARLIQNPDEICMMSKLSQRNMFQRLSFNNTQLKIFEAIERHINKPSSKL